MANKHRKTDKLTLLVTCVGRRVELIQAFRAAAKRLGVALRIIGADSDVTAPALGCVDQAVLVPPIADESYISTLLETVDHSKSDALLPTIDTDLLPISRHREAFDAAGCLALIATPEVIDICRDKMETWRFLSAAGIDTPQTFTPDQIRARSSDVFPYLIKPRFGSAGRWVHKLEDERDMAYYLAKVSDPIVQEYVDGLEHTLDVYVGLHGKVRCVVPRVRWEVRGGEVSKGVVVKDREIMDAGKRVVEALGDSVRGVVTLQCMVTTERRICFIEINPRFGGGAPLGIAAGADYAGWLIEELCGGEPEIAFDGFQHGLCMQRYDWSEFVALDENLKPRLGEPKWEYPAFG